MSNNAEQAKETCFVIMPFTDPEGYEPGHFRKIYEQLFKPAIEKAGYSAHRVDDEIESTMIHGKLLEQLITAPIVLCDLSSKNPNVLYELGIRHAFDLPVVLVQEMGQSHIFDIGGITTVDYRKHRLYDEVIEDQNKIAEAIKQTVANKSYSIMSLVQTSPAKVKNGTEISREDRVMIVLDDIRRRMNRLEKRLADREREQPIYQASIEESPVQQNAKKRLLDAIDQAELVRLKGSNKEIDFMYTIMNLQEAIHDSQIMGLKDERLIETAKTLLLTLHMAFEKSKESPK